MMKYRGYRFIPSELKGPDGEVAERKIQIWFGSDKVSVVEDEQEAVKVVDLWLNAK